MLWHYIVSVQLWLTQEVLLLLLATWVQSVGYFATSPIYEFQALEIFWVFWCWLLLNFLENFDFHSNHFILLTYFEHILSIAISAILWRDWQVSDLIHSQILVSWNWFTNLVFLLKNLIIESFVKRLAIAVDDLVVFRLHKWVVF